MQWFLHGSIRITAAHEDAGNFRHHGRLLKDLPEIPAHHSNMILRGLSLSMADDAIVKHVLLSQNMAVLKNSRPGFSYLQWLENNFVLENDAAKSGFCSIKLRNLRNLDLWKKQFSYFCENKNWRKYHQKWPNWEDCNAYFWTHLLYFSLSAVNSYNASTLVENKNIQIQTKQKVNSYNASTLVENKNIQIQT